MGRRSSVHRRWRRSPTPRRARRSRSDFESLCKVFLLLNQPMRYSTSTFQRFGFSSSAPQQDNKEANKQTDDGGNKSIGSQSDASNEANKTAGAEKAPEADTEDLNLSKEDLVKLVLEKEELLKSKDEEIKDMKDKALRSYAEMENVIARTKRESENSKNNHFRGVAASGVRQGPSPQLLQAQQLLQLRQNIAVKGQLINFRLHHHEALEMEVTI